MMKMETLAGWVLESTDPRLTVIMAHVRTERHGLTQELKTGMGRAPQEAWLLPPS